MLESEIKEKIRNYVRSSFFLFQEKEIEDDTSFLNAGIIDSTGLMEIVSFIQTEFRLYIADHDLLPSNLDSINNITKFLLRNGI
ncbi:MAG TPA: acyl carrier protein [Chitinispirillaceae bacterium]|nr:acyl carrier protein [Chitinispirillaceae bacterium]